MAKAIKGEDDAIQLNTSRSCTTSPASKLEQQSKRQMMRVKSDNTLSTMANIDRVCAFRKGLAPVAKIGKWEINFSDQIKRFTTKS